MGFLNGFLRLALFPCLFYYDEAVRRDTEGEDMVSDEALELRQLSSGQLELRDVKAHAKLVRSHDTSLFFKKGKNETEFQDSMRSTSAGSQACMYYAKMDAKSEEDVGANAEKLRRVEKMVAPLISSYNLGLAFEGEVQKLMDGELTKMFTRLAKKQKKRVIFHRGSGGKAGEIMLAAFWMSAEWRTLGGPHISQAKAGSTKGVIAQTFANDKTKQAVTLTGMDLGTKRLEKQNEVTRLSDHLSKMRQQVPNNFKYAAFGTGDMNSRICLTQAEVQKYNQGKTSIDGTDLTAVTSSILKDWNTTWRSLDGLASQDGPKAFVEPINTLMQFNDGARPWTYKRWCKDGVDNNIYDGCSSCTAACPAGGDDCGCSKWCKTRQEGDLTCLQLGVLDRVGAWTSNDFGSVGTVEAFPDATWCIGDHSAMKGIINLKDGDKKHKDKHHKDKHHKDKHHKDKHHKDKHHKDKHHKDKHHKDKHHKDEHHRRRKHHADEAVDDE